MDEKKVIKKENLLKINMVATSSTFLNTVLSEDIYAVLYFDGTEEELDEKIETGKMIKIYADEDFEDGHNGESYWKIKGSTITSYIIDDFIEDEEDQNKKINLKKDGNVLTIDFKDKKD